MNQAKQGIVDLLTRIGDDKIMMQGLSTCLRGARVIKGGGTEIRFGTDATDPSQIMNGTSPIGLVLWLDPKDVDAAREAFDEAQVGAAVDHQMQVLGSELKDLAHTLQREQE
jgi:hypothetical protein